MRPRVRSWHPPGSSQPGYVSHGRTLIHCTRVVGCQEVVIAAPGAKGRVAEAARRAMSEMCNSPATLRMTTGDVIELRCDAYYTVWIRSAPRVLSSSAGLRRNHEDKSSSSSISWVGTDAVLRSGGE